METPDDFLPENPALEALQRRCFTIYVLLMLLNTLLASTLMWNLLDILQLGIFIAAVSLAHLVGLIISLSKPFGKLKSTITVIIVVSVIAISPVAIISHIFGNRANYIWVVLAPMAFIVLYPEMSISRSVSYFCSAIFLILILMIIANGLIPIFHGYLEGWYIHIASHKVSMIEKIAILQPVVAIPIFIFYFLYYIQKINELRLLQAHNSVSSGQFTRNEEMSVARYTELFSAIEDYCEKNKPYLDPTFSIAQLAAHLNSNTTYISRAISIHNGMSFTTYINAYRVRHAKEMIRHNSNEYTLEYIYSSSGFQNQSTFNRVFKQMEGFTPSEYFDEH